MAVEKRKRISPHYFASNVNGSKKSEESGRAVVAGDDHFVADTAGASGGLHQATSSSATGALRTGNAPHIRSRTWTSRNERWSRMEDSPAAEHWNYVFGATTDNLGRSSVTGGPWQVSAFALLGMIVVLSAIFLHLLAESSNGSDSHHHSNSQYYHQRRRQRQQRRMYKIRKKKTDEWSDDEEELQNSAQLAGGILVSTSGGNNPPSSTSPQREPSTYQNLYPFYYHQPPQPSHMVPRFAIHQEHRHRRHKEPSAPISNNANGSNYYYMQSPSQQGLVPTYRSPSTTLKNLTNRSPNYNSKPVTTITTTRRQVGASAALPKGGAGPSPGGAGFVTSTTLPPLSGRLRMPTPPDAQANVVSTASNASNLDGFSNQASSSSSSITSTQRSRIPTPPAGSQLVVQQPPYMPAAGASETKFNLSVRPQNNVSPFHTTSRADGVALQKRKDNKTPSLQLQQSLHPPSSSEHSASLNELLGSSSKLQFNDSTPRGTGNAERRNSLSTNHSSLHHSFSLSLSPGNAFAETPRVGNGRRILQVDDKNDQHHQPPPPVQQLPRIESFQGVDKSEAAFAQLPQKEALQAQSDIPMIPSLGYKKPHQPLSNNSTTRTSRAPPSSVFTDDLKLGSMETGEIHWEQNTEENTQLDHESSCSSSEEEEENVDDISIPSNDIRGQIHHTRNNLTDETNATASLQSSIRFEELRLQEVIGGGGFGQVWRAEWRCTPVAVKILTGSAQGEKVAKAVLEEFRAEINLLKGMRHPNICLYMGACVDPPNRAIITELAANGSVWDALRLPLLPPFVPADGTHRGAWPIQLYLPDQHGLPPTSDGRNDMPVPRMTAPIPPKGTWPWELVKRVACGAARGMAYLHSGNPPVLHRDLKSANLLLVESYTTKVCDFGLSRLKAQERSMTGNCGTVQWMAPEILANRRYNEKADVYSFGIICWELLTRECPYEGMSAIQCALAVLNREKRPEIPKWCPPSLHALIKACVKQDPSERPTFAQILLAFDAMG